MRQLRWYDNTTTVIRRDNWGDTMRQLRWYNNLISVIRWDSCGDTMRQLRWYDETTGVIRRNNFGDTMRHCWRFSITRNTILMESILCYIYVKLNLGESHYFPSMLEIETVNLILTLYSTSSQAPTILWKKFPFRNYINIRQVNIFFLNVKSLNFIFRGYKIFITIQVNMDNHYPYLKHLSF
jgi:hypothetical protein